MHMKPKMILIASAVVSLIAFLGAVNALGNKQTQPNAIVTALRDIDAGQTAQIKDIKLIVPSKDFDPAIVFTKINAVAGQIARNPIRRGQVITSFDLLDKSDRITFVIPEGYRVSTIPLSSPNSMLDFLKQGSRVDVLFTDPEKSFETRTIMKNVAVVKVSTPEKNSPGADNFSAFISLAVPPDASETLAYAVRKGKIDLSVRPDAERSKVEEYMKLGELTGIKKSMISPLLNHNDIELIRGTKRSTVRI